MKLQIYMLMIIVSISCVGAVDARARTYRIATVAWVGWSPLHVAEAKGFWASQGVDVEVVDYDDPIIVLEAARSGKIDLAMDMAGSLVGSYMNGESVMAIAETNWSHGGDKIIVKAGHGIREYIGQPLGVFLNLPSCLYFLGLYLETQDLTLTSYRIVEIHPDDLTAQFTAGRIPVIVNYEPWASVAIEGGGQALVSSADFEGCIPECMWGYRSQIERIPADDIKRILTGWLQAVQWSQAPQNQADYFEILNTATFQDLPNYSEEKLQAMLDNVRIHSQNILIQRNRTGGGLDQYLASLRQFLEKYEMLRRDYSTREIFDNRWIMDVLR